MRAKAPDTTTDPAPQNDLALRDSVFVEIGMTRMVSIVSMCFLIAMLDQIITRGMSLFVGVAALLELISICCSIQAQAMTAYAMRKSYAVAAANPGIQFLYAAQNITTLAGALILVIAMFLRT